MSQNFELQIRVIYLERGNCFYASPFPFFEVTAHFLEPHLLRRHLS